MREWIETFQSGCRRRHKNVSLCVREWIETHPGQVFRITTGGVSLCVREWIETQHGGTELEIDIMSPSA